MKNFIKFSLLAFIITTPSFALAAKPVETEFGPIANVGEFIIKIFDWLVPMTGLLALIMFVFAGYIYITSQGDQNSIKTAKEIVLGVITGIILLFTIKLLLQRIIGTL